MISIANSPIKTKTRTIDSLSIRYAKSILISPADVAIDHLFPPYTPAKVQALHQWFDY